MTGFKQHILFIFLFIISIQLNAQDGLEYDPLRLHQINAIKTIENSVTHLYILSETEGLIVFRTNQDTLQWLFNSEGMHNRGNRIIPDSRFSYLYGLNNQITVLEPTSLLGVFSSTTLIDTPISMSRFGSYLYLAMGSNGLYRLSLEIPSGFDSEPEKIEIRGTDFRNVRFVFPFSQQFLVLTDQQLHFLNSRDGELQHDRSVRISQNISRLLSLKEALFALNDTGDFFEVRANGSLRKAFSIGEKVYKASVWNDGILVRGESGIVYFVKEDNRLITLRNNVESGNYFTIINNELWINEYEKFGPAILKISEPNRIPGVIVTTPPTARDILKLKKINNIILPAPRPLLLTMEVEGNYPVNEIRFRYSGPLENVNIQGKGLYWQPRPVDTGSHLFTIVVVGRDGQTDSTQFHVDIRNFNSPPRFNPLRPITISVDENFTLPIKAADPDGMDSDLIRYLGVDLPEGSSLSEQTGMFTWRPDRRQTGIHSFRIIATDQYGAAASQQITITVRHFDQD